MTDIIRFHLDENVDPAVADALRRRGVDVSTTREAGLLRAGDDKQLAFVESEGRILVTHDADFLRIHRDGETHPGIVYCAHESRTLSEIVAALLLIRECLTPQDMRRHVEYL